MARRPSSDVARPSPQLREAIDTSRREIANGSYQAAESILEPALRAAPRNADLLHLLGSVHLATGRIDSSIKLLRKAVKVAPKVALYAYNLGNALLAGHRQADALKAFRSAGRLDSSLAEAHTNAGLILIQLSRHEEAIEAFRHALRVAPQVPQHHLNLALAEFQSGNQTAAAKTLEAACRSGRTLDAAFHISASSMFAKMKRFERAEAAAREASSLAPRNPDAYVVLAEALNGLHRIDEAIGAYRLAVEHGYAVSRGDLRIAEALTDAGRQEQALAQVDDNLAKYPDDAQVLQSAARVMSRCGDYQRQEQLLRRVLELNPDNVEAINQLLSVPGRQVAPEQIARLASLLSDEEHAPAPRSRLGFALGNYHHEHGDHERAFECYAVGNRLRGLQYDRRALERCTGATINCLSAGFFAERTGWGLATRLPLLIVGLPRSGTTLIEQIISAHPSVTGAGELGAIPDLAATPDADLSDARDNPAELTRLRPERVVLHAERYLAQLDAVAPAGQAFISNKYPANFRYLGLFALLFPQAPVIHVRRDPRDTLLSIFFHDFEGSHSYAYDLKALGHYYRQYQRLMAHWRTALPNPLLEIDYEDVVDDQPGAARRLAEFLGLSWDEAMCRYYEQQREVRTASHWQVRQPIYRSAIGRWRLYQAQLAPLLREIGELQT